MFKSLDGTKKVFKNYVKKNILKVKNASLKKVNLSNKRKKNGNQKTTARPAKKQVITQPC